MGAVITNTVGDELTVDPTSKAARVELYAPDGTALLNKPTGSYLANILIRQSSAAATNVMVWGLANPSSTKVLKVMNLRIAMLFDGTSPGVQGRNYYVFRTDTAVATSGTAITPTKKRSADAASVADVRFLDTGLTQGSLVRVGTPLFRISLPENVTGLTDVFEFMVLPARQPITLRYLQGIGIFVGDATANTVIGTGLCGYAEWDEV